MQRRMVIGVAAIVAAGLCAAPLGEALAQAEPIAARRAAMKDAGSQFYGVLARMNRDQAPFDAAAASQAFSRTAEQITIALANFPEGSKTGDTRALPAIWDSKADFEALGQAAAAAAKAAVGAPAQGEAAFKTAFAEVNARCGACHEKYRGR